MALLKLRNLGASGIITDRLSVDLPQTAFSDGKNIRFMDGKAVKFLGEESYYAPSANWDGGNKSQIYYLMPVADGSDYYWIFCGLNDVRVYDKSTDTAKEITNSGGS